VHYHRVCTRSRSLCLCEVLVHIASLSGLEEVMCQLGELWLRILRVERLERLPRTSMQLDSARCRQLVIERFANQRMRKAKPPVRARHRREKALRNRLVEEFQKLVG